MPDTHLVNESGERSLCGIKDPLPVCLVRWAPAHQYPHDRCPVCFEKAGLVEMLNLQLFHD